MSAQTPEEIYKLFAKFLNAGDLDSLVSLYEPGATFVPQPGVVVSGQAAIREAIAGFLALKGTIDLQPPTVFKAGDIALLLAKWTLKGTAPGGGPLELAGQTSDVVRRQPDYSWLFVIDNPNGAASAV